MNFKQISDAEIVESYIYSNGISCNLDVILQAMGVSMLEVIEQQNVYSIKSLEQDLSTYINTMDFVKAFELKTSEDVFCELLTWFKGAMVDCGQLHAEQADAYTIDRESFFKAYPYKPSNTKANYLHFTK